MARVSRDQKAALALIEELVGDDMPGWMYNHRDKIADHFKRYAASALESLTAENAVLKADIEQRDEFIKELSDALLSIRPLGGSELFVRRFGKYFADPKYCKAAIQAQSSKLNETMKEGVRQRKANATLLQQRNEAFERAAELLRLLTRYRKETPLGNQPHMIAHEADEAIAKSLNFLSKES